MAAGSTPIPNGGARHRSWLRTALTLAGIALLVMLATVLAGGLPVVLLVLGLLVAVGVVLAPLAGMTVMMVSQIIWLLGAYAPAGIGLLAASKVFTGLVALGLSLIHISEPTRPY